MIDEIAMYSFLGGVPVLLAYLAVAHARRGTQVLVLAVLSPFYVIPWTALWIFVLPRRGPQLAVLAHGFVTFSVLVVLGSTTGLAWWVWDWRRRRAARREP